MNTLITVGPPLVDPPKNKDTLNNEGIFLCPNSDANDL